ncbi:MAG TPA: protein translocase subunit SecF [Acidobacteriaceae bacterium]|nr:protein translocase subunit SecF [Acidobacteriaceae bacterium]
MELFRDVNIDWLGKKWYFLGFSLIFSVAGVLSMLFWHHIPQGVDFKGGTNIRVQFASTPNEEDIRRALSAGGVKDPVVQRISDPGGRMSNMEVISLPLSSATDQAHDQGRQIVENALNANYHDSAFSIQQIDIVGPTAGKQLQRQAALATLYSLAGMLIYLWFRFELIYGVAAVVAVFHDTLITVGAFSLTNQEITLTVIAAILTLIGYSMNDTIVVFDRIRENLALSRRETLPDVVNRSINQTLSRTVLTSGLTFLTVLSLLVFGGPVLRGFSFALVVGVLIGTYSSIAVAAPMLVAYQDWRKSRGKTAVLPAKKARV